MENCGPELRDDVIRFLRLACLLLHISPRALRRYFDLEFHPDKLQALLLQNKIKIFELKERRIITQTQYDLLYPAGEVSSKNFDMTLMTFLLRNFTHLSFSGKLPPDHLINPGSDISRLGHYRNVIVHSKDGCVSDDEFHTIWRCVSQAIGRLAQEAMGNGEISFLLESTLSGSIDIDSIQQEVNQQKQLDELTERVSKLETENINRSEIRRKTISNWLEEENKFVITKISELVTETLTKQKAVILVGHPGCGKSATAKHVALKLRREEGYEIEEVDQPDEIVKYYNSNTKQLFLIEDICGKFAIDQHKADQWTENDSKIEKLLQPNTNNKFIITTRVSIYKSECFPQLKCLDIQECNFAGTTKLSNEEMRSIALSYIPRDTAVSIDDSTFEQFPFFPLMCRIYTNMTEQDPNFFKYPIKLIEKEVNDIKQRHKSSFVALCLLVLHNNALEKKMFKSNSSGITNCVEMIILETEVDYVLSLVKVEQSLKHKLHLFVTENESEYVAIHDKMFDIISVIIIPLMFNCVIKFGNSSLLSSRIQFRSLDEKPNDFVQLLPTDLESTYFDRLHLDIEQGCHWDVFGNIQTRFKQYRQLFLNNFSKMQLKVTTVGNDGSTPLFVSAYKGYQDFVEYLVDKFPEQIVQRDEHKRSPLYIACKQGHVGVVRYLLLFDKDVHQLQNRNCTPFYISCQMGHVDIAKLLIQHDSKYQSEMDQYKTKTSAPLQKDDMTKGRHDILINKPMDTGLTPLMAAAYKGYVDVVTFLLDVNVAVDSADDNKSTALHYACINNHADIVRLLVSYGAEVDPIDQWHQSPFYISCSYGYIDIIKLLLFGNKPIKRSIGSKKGISLSSDNPSLCFPFSHHNLQINKCVDLNVMDFEGDTALHAACYNGHIEVGKLLIEMGMNVNVVNYKGQTPLLMACAKGFFNIAKFLIDNNANINQSDNEKFTPLFYASQGNLDTVKLLIKHNCDVNAKNCDDISALHKACSNGHAKIVDILIGNGANINACGGGGKTPLFYAARNNKLDVIELLLSRGAKVNYREGDGGTPLQGACKYGHRDAVVSLLKYDADVNAARCLQIKPMVLAKEGGYYDIEEILQEQLKKMRV
ncbi:uncharacterized protein LOC127714833 [Mytilus californianus]|uniref:uncharacterized protein LOC127714833 n=1 Tax=Mytilus californianus TaxID=6549 RepID=UPI002246A753|nr:uncharacterized protein LOC127714833 [Mytilus californianus]